MSENIPILRYVAHGAAPRGTSRQPLVLCWPISDRGQCQENETNIMLIHYEHSLLVFIKHIHYVYSLLICFTSGKFICGNVPMLAFAYVDSTSTGVMKDVNEYVSEYLNE